MLLTKYLKPIKQKLIEPEEDRLLVIVKTYYTVSIVIFNKKYLIKI